MHIEFRLDSLIRKSHLEVSFEINFIGIICGILKWINVVQDRAQSRDFVYCHLHCYHQHRQHLQAIILLALSDSKFQIRIGCSIPLKLSRNI
jgi:hypothetical protein